MNKFQVADVIFFKDGPLVKWDFVHEVEERESGIYYHTAQGFLIPAAEAW